MRGILGCLITYVLFSLVILLSPPSFQLKLPYLRCSEATVGLIVARRSVELLTQLKSHAFCDCCEKRKMNILSCRTMWWNIKERWMWVWNPKFCFRGLFVSSNIFYCIQVGVYLWRKIFLLFKSNYVFQRDSADFPNYHLKNCHFRSFSFLN